MDSRAGMMLFWNTGKGKKIFCKNRATYELSILLEIEIAVLIVIILFINPRLHPI
jgi:hypothetical protein